MIINIKDFENWLSLNGCGAMTYANYVKPFVTPFNDISEITSQSISDFILKKKNENMSLETLNMYIKSIRALLRFLKLDLETPKLFKPILKLPEFIRLEYLEREIIAIVPDLFEKNAERVQAILYFMFYTGLRKSEVEQLQRKNFNFQEKEVKVYCPKTKKERLIPLNDKLIGILEKYFAEEEEFGNAFNLHTGSIDYIFSILKPHVKIVNLHPHLFRDSFAMNLQRNGFTTREIQNLLGHNSILTTIKYERADIGLMKEKFNKNIK